VAINDLKRALVYKTDHDQTYP